MSGFTSVLKKIGVVLTTAGQIASEVLGFPFLAQFFGGAPSKLLGTVMTGVSDFGSLAQIASILEAGLPTTGSGSQRLQQSIPAVQQLFMTWAESNLPGHNKVKDPQKLATAMGTMMSGFVDALNSLGD